MATEEFLKRSIAAGKPYEALPERIRAAVSVTDWRHRVKDHCVHRGLNWQKSLAKSACTEGEYYEDLVAYYRNTLRLFPYHLSDYICRVMRITPFRYGCDLLYAVMREEKSYDQIPNFTAADIVRLARIGRNEYIAIMNKCKAKRLLWRVNRAIVKEMLPTEPADVDMQPWWTVNVVNLGETEYRQLTAEELSICQSACKAGGLRVSEVGVAALQPLYKRGLIYLDVNIRPSDHVSIPPLEGFVSNKDSEVGDDKGDPLEAALYAMFVATSGRASVAELAAMLSVDQALLQAAVSVACRLGFAIRLPSATHPGEESRVQGSPDGVDADSATDSGGLSASQSGQMVAEGAASAREPQGIALVVDAEVTSYLMMGALSPGLKRHSVTLFEGGRITGSEVIEELIKELYASFEAAQQFEGEMQALAGYASALAAALECIRDASGVQPIELLRKESLAGLAPAAASRVLSHSYAAVVPIAPLPAPPLPLSPSRPGPTNFGATVEAATPWLHLALYRAASSGPESLVLICGQRFQRLPPQLASCTHALVWPWDADAVRAQSVPVVLDSTFLLYSLNEYLSRTALLIQPLVVPSTSSADDLPYLDLPLPLSLKPGPVKGFKPRTAEEAEVELPSGIAGAISTLGMQHALGRLRLFQVAELHQGGQGSGTQEPSGHGRWLPLSLQLGLPLQPDNLCRGVCRAAQEAKFLEVEARKAHAAGQSLLQQHLFSLISEFGACSNCLAPAADKPEQALGYVDMPIKNLLVSGGDIRPLDFQAFVQGVITLFTE